MLYSAPLPTLMVVGTLVPVTLIGVDTCGVPGSTLVSGTKWKGLGTALMPVPLSVTVVGAAEALLVMSKVPLRLPSLAGVNMTWMVQLVPLRGALPSLLWLKFPVVAILLMSAPLVPVTIMVCAALAAPTVCGAKDNVPGLASSVTAHETVELTEGELLAGSGSTKVEELPKSAFAELLTTVPQAAAASVPVMV